VSSLGFLPFVPFFAGLFVIPHAISLSCLRKICDFSFFVDIFFAKLWRQIGDWIMIKLYFNKFKNSKLETLAVFSKLRSASGIN